MNTLHTAPQASRTVRFVSAASAAAITLVLFSAVTSMGGTVLPSATLAAKPAPILVASR